MKEKKKSFVLYTDYAEQIKTLPMEEIGRLFCAILDYADGVKDVELSPAASMAFAFIRQQMDRDRVKYEEEIERRKASGQKGGLARAANASRREESQGVLRSAKECLANQADNDNGTENENENETENENENVTEDVTEHVSSTVPQSGAEQGTEGTHTFHPPTLEEVLSYCAERGNKVDGERFYHYYTANGWRTGGNPIRSWKAMLLCWEKSPRREAGEGKKSAPPAKKIRFCDYAAQRPDDDYDRLEKEAIEYVKNFQK